MRGGTPGCPDIPDWLAEDLPEGARIGVDPYLHTVSPLTQRKSYQRQDFASPTPAMQRKWEEKMSRKEGRGVKGGE